MRLSCKPRSKGDRDISYTCTSPIKILMHIPTDVLQISFWITAGRYSRVQPPRNVNSATHCPVRGSILRLTDPSNWTLLTCIQQHATHRFLSHLRLQSFGIENFILSNIPTDYYPQLLHFLCTSRNHVCRPSYSRADSS